MNKFIAINIYRSSGKGGLQKIVPYACRSVFSLKFINIVFIKYGLLQ